MKYSHVFTVILFLVFVFYLQFCAKEDPVITELNKYINSLEEYTLGKADKSGRYTIPSNALQKHKTNPIGWVYKKYTLDKDRNVPLPIPGDIEYVGDSTRFLPVGGKHWAKINEGDIIYRDNNNFIKYGKKEFTPEWKRRNMELRRLHSSNQ